MAPRPMARPSRRPTVSAGVQNGRRSGRDPAMHPSMYQELARIKIAEQHEQAARHRLARAATRRVEPRPVALTSVRVRVGRALGRLGSGLRGASAGTGA
jgi:hypothetical protein